MSAFSTISRATAAAVLALLVSHSALTASQQDLIDHKEQFQDWDNPMYSNIQAFRQIDSALEIHGMAMGAQ